MHLSKSGAEAVVRLLGLEAAVEKQRSGSSADPRVSVANTPDGNTNTVLNIQASSDSSLVVSGSTTLDVKLSHGALGSRLAEKLESSGVVGDGPAAGQVGLGTNTVNGNTGGNPLLDVASHGLGLSVAGAVEVVVVDVELGLWVGGLGSSESGGDKVLTENVVEDGRAERTVFVEDLVDYVPSIDLAGVGAHELLDVSNHDFLELSLVGDGRDPGGKLRMPDGGVTADELLVLRGKADERVGTVESELALGTLGGIPLHTVLRSNLAEVCDDDLLVLSLAECALVGSNTDVLLAVRLECSIERALGTVGTGSGNIRSRAVGTAGGSRLSNRNRGGDGLASVHRRYRGGRRNDGCRRDASSSRRSRGVSTTVDALAVPVVALDARPALSALGLALEAVTTALSVGSDGSKDS